MLYFVGHCIFPFSEYFNKIFIINNYISYVILYKQKKEPKNIIIFIN